MIPHQCCTLEQAKPKIWTPLWDFVIRNSETAKIRQIVLLKIAGPVLVVFFLYVATAFAVWGFETAQGRNFEQALEDAGMTREEIWKTM